MDANGSYMMTRMETDTLFKEAISSFHFSPVFFLVKCHCLEMQFQGGGKNTFTCHFLPT